ncbi:hypothetical protein INT48_001488 [Thamnidium elegans]|uniref:Uncharacterized protein n=1 Tax=Thamnidium elegans TaxID=101142 RepID=A0A8H7SKV1_9FUNG|nr:hypothetical protein INT48_001488 [Thamnidium elegans]
MPTMSPVSYAPPCNAWINFHKTEAFALYAKRSIYDTTWRTPLVPSNIPVWHDITAAASIIYLGYSIFHSPLQREVFLNSLLSKLEFALRSPSSNSSQTVFIVGGIPDL